MLKLRSLKARAAAIFAAVFAAVFVSGFVLLAWSSLSTAGERHHAGPSIALKLAAGEARLSERGISIDGSPRLQSLARANPSLWILAHADGRTHAYGKPPVAATRLFERYRGVVASGRFHVPGVPRPLADASIEQLGDATLAAGGIDPRTITLADALTYVGSEGLLLMLLALGTLGLVAMLVALPLLTTALGRVSAAAAVIDSASPDRRIGEEGVPTELLPLVRSFNAALERLSDELARRKRFTMDVAHELRTPLAVMSLQLEAMAPGEQSNDLARVLARMSHLVGQMLDVERLSLQPADWGVVDLVELGREAISEFAPLAIASGYRLGLQAPDAPVLVRGDGHALTRAIANLLGNAIAHGGGVGEIRMTIAGDATLEVLDDGPGVPEDLRATLFEPFSRARHDRDGCGMGLHLTREILRAHGGDAELLPSPRGARFRLRLPGATGA